MTNLEIPSSSLNSGVVSVFSLILYDCKLHQSFYPSPSFPFIFTSPFSLFPSHPPLSLLPTHSSHISFFNPQIFPLQDRWYAVDTFPSFSPLLEHISYLLVSSINAFPRVKALFVPPPLLRPHVRFLRCVPFMVRAFPFLARTALRTAVIRWKYILMKLKILCIRKKTRYD